MFLLILLVLVSWSAHGTEDPFVKHVCTDTCKGQPDGQYLDCYRCDRFVVCSGHQLSHMSCPSTTVYHGRIGVCVSQRQPGCGRTGQRKPVLDPGQTLLAQSDTQEGQHITISLPFFRQTTSSFYQLTKPPNPPTTPPFDPPTTPPFDSPTTPISDPPKTPTFDPPTTPLSDPPTTPPSDPPTTPLSDPPTTPLSDPPTTPLSDPPTTPLSDPPTTPLSDPPTTPLSDPPTTPLSDPPTTPNSDPPTTPLSDPPTTPNSDPPTTPLSDPPTTPLSDPPVRDPADEKSPQGSKTATYDPRDVSGDITGSGPDLDSYGSDYNNFQPTPSPAPRTCTNCKNSCDEETRTNRMIVSCDDCCYIDCFTGTKICP